MKKRIIDIAPPKTEKREVLKVKRKGFKKRFLFLIFLFLIIGFFGSQKMSLAKIAVWPKTELSNFKLEVTIDNGIENINFSQNLIPGQIFESEKVISREFPASGKVLKEEEAEGVIRVYNNYSTNPQILVATTRFVSKEGKLFRSIEKVVVPGGHYDKGKLVPGEYDVKVKADEAGEEYNISSSTFSLPGLIGTAQYTSIYGKSFDSMKGGFKKEVSQVKEEDLESAKEALSNIAKKEGEESVKEKVPEEFIFLKDILKVEVLDPFSSVKAGDEVEKFNYQIKIKSKTLSFRQSDIEDFVKNYILSRISKDKRIQTESLKINFSIKNFDLESGKIFLSLDTSAKIYQAVDFSLMKGSLSGKTIPEAQNSLEEQPEINKVQIKIIPFWIKRLPENTEKIEMQLNID